MSRKLALSTLLCCTAFTPAFSHSPVDAGHPIIPQISDLLPFAGELITVTVPLSAQATSAGTISISSTTAGNFLLIPSSVGYNAGDSSVTFTALISPLATGSIEITASNNSGSASVSEMLQAIVGDIQ